MLALPVLFLGNTNFVNPTDDTTPLAPPPKCNCGNVKFTVTATKADGTSKAVNVDVPMNNSSTANNVKMDGFDIKDGDVVRLTVSGITVGCPCSAGGQCQSFPPKPTGGPDFEKPGKVKLKPGTGEQPENDLDAINDNHRCIRIKPQGTTQEEGWLPDGSYLMHLKFFKMANSSAGGCYQKIHISTYCQSPECGSPGGTLCYRTFKINFKRPT